MEGKRIRKMSETGRRGNIVKEKERTRGRGSREEQCERQ